MIHPRELVIGSLLILVIILLPPTNARAAISCASVDADHTIHLRFDEPTTAFNTVYRPNEPLLFRVDSSPNSASFSWAINGKTVSGTGAELCFVFDRAGLQKGEVVEATENKKISFELTTTSYSNITLAKILPNPSGADTNAEEIYLANGNPFPVTLANWQLKSKTTSTVIPINVAIPAASQSVVKSSNKLRNEDGAYDLLNESGVSVDSVSYPSTQEGVYITRENGIWVVPQKASPKPKQSNEETASAVSPAGEVTVTLEGKVILPEGRSFDIQTVDGKTVHVVLHASFTGEKPKFHKGDTIKVSGVWKESKNGQYLSVRDGDTLELVASSADNVNKTTDSSGKAPLDLSSVSTDEGESSAEPQTESPNNPSSKTQKNSQPIEASVLAADQSLRWLFIIMVMIGVVLALPYKRPSPL